ncbi:MAG TPA: DNA-3-methyladenine glycosylase I [Thermohalobaculum sp.]|nr:DNA-3-methyladenine glycosylase I [Thermohalobaculum sp.]
MPTPHSFDALFAMAAARKGGANAFEKTLPSPKTPTELAAIPDHRWLATMTRAVFQAGFSWKVIEAKWPGFESAFWGFDPSRCSMMSDDDLDALLKDKSIVRNGAKIRSVAENASFLRDLAAEHGTAAKAFATWPATDYVGLLTVLKKRAARLGGTSGQYFLRTMGVDSFVLSRDVVRALIREGVVDKEPTSQRDLARVQAAFDNWRAESGRPMAQISRTLACSIE